MNIKITTAYGKVHYRIIYPRCEYPIRTESEGRINDEFISLALSGRSFIRNSIRDAEAHENIPSEYISDYSFEMRPTYVGNLFVSFLMEIIATTNTGKVGITYGAKTYKTSSAKRVTLEMLFRVAGVKEILWERIISSSSVVSGKCSFEDFLIHYKITDFFLTSEEMILFFPPDSIVRDHNEYIIVPIKYKELKDSLKYQIN